MNEKELFDFLEKWIEPITERIEALELEIKGIKQQLTEVLNLEPTITQKKMWLDELITIVQIESMQKAMSNKIRELIELPEAVIIWDTIELSKDLNKEYLLKLRKLK